MALEKWLEEYFAEHRELDKDEQETLHSFARWCHPGSPAAVEAEQIQQYFDRLQAERRRDGSLCYSDADLADRYKAVRRFFRFLSSQHHVAVDPFLSLTTRVHHLREGKVISEAQWASLLASIGTGSDLLSSRDHMVLFSILHTAGHSAAVLPLLDVGDVHPDEGRILWKRKQRASQGWLPLGPEGTLAMRQYLQLRDPVAPAEVGSLLIGPDGSPDPYAVQDMLHRVRRILGGRWPRLGWVQFATLVFSSNVSYARNAYAWGVRALEGLYAKHLDLCESPRPVPE